MDMSGRAVTGLYGTVPYMPYRGFPILIAVPRGFETPGLYFSAYFCMMP